jgi:hypothetical protein
MHDNDPKSGSFLGGYWLDYKTIREVADRLGIEVVPLMKYCDIMEAVEYVRYGFNSTVALAHGNTGVPAEGLVGRPAIAMYTSMGNRIITKLKTRDFKGKQ